MPVSRVSRNIALVAIDLQQGIVGLPVAPYTGSQVVQTTAALGDLFRTLKLAIVWVNTSYAPDGSVALKPRVDQPSGAPVLDPAWSQLDPGLRAQHSDIFVTKHQWGAFTGTDLDVRLRRRGITDIVLTGIATNIGVESTARDAYERGYNTVVAADAVSTYSVDYQTFALTQILPKIAQIDSSTNIAAAVQHAVSASAPRDT